MDVKTGLGICKVFFFPPIDKFNLKNILGNEMKFISGHESTESVPIIIIPTLLNVHFVAHVTSAG